LDHRKKVPDTDPLERQKIKILIICNEHTMKTIIRFPNILFILPLAFIFICCSNGLNGKFNYIPPAGYVPDKETAIKIAEAIWLPVYGSTIYEKQPFVAELQQNVWIVKGTVEGQFGGAPYIEVSKKNGRILTMYHEK
jgi:hypothetical protein